MNEYFLKFKAHQYVKREDWQLISPADLKQWVREHGSQIESGEYGIWLKPAVYDAAGSRIADWILLDIEATGHDDISANIEAGRTFLLWLTEKKLIGNLQVMLSGRGLRFAWPLLVPPKMRELYLEWLRDEQFSCIDTSPQMKDSFFRLLAYRGHSNQGSIKDVHVHPMSSIDAFWFMDKSDYLEAAGGSVPVELQLEWLERILPKEHIGSRWADMFNGYALKNALKGSLFQAEFTGKPVRTTADWDHIEGELKRRGITKYLKNCHGTDIYRLSECPVCCRKGCAWLTLSGRLKCWHANTCEAGGFNSRGEKPGFYPGKWIDGYQGVAVDMEDLDLETVAVDVAREQISGVVRKDKGDILLTPTPGAGKSTTTLMEIIPMAKRKSILYVTPQKDLNSELFDKARKIADRHFVKVIWIRGREGHESGRSATCYRMTDIERFQRRGFSPAITVCNRCGFKFRYECPYYGQMKEIRGPGLYVTTHAQAIYLCGKFQFDVMVVDENPVDYFHEKETVGINGLKALAERSRDIVAEPIVKLLDLVRSGKKVFTDDDEYTVSRFYAGGGPAGSQWEGARNFWDMADISFRERTGMQGDLEQYEQFEEETPTSWQRRLSKSGVSLRVLQWLWAALRGDMGRTAYIEMTKKGNAKLVYFRKTIPVHEGRIIVLDGTGDKAEMDSLFSRDFRLVSANVELRGCQTIHIAQGIGKTKAVQMDTGKIEAVLRKAVEYLRPHDRKVLLGTFKAVETKVLEVLRHMIPDRIVDSVHYWAGRGLNRYEHYDAFIGFGVPTVRYTGKLDEAMMLFEDPKERSTWLYMCGQKDLVQTAHRIRPVHGGKNIIVVGKDWPVEYFGDAGVVRNLGRGDKVADRMDLAYQRLHSWVSLYGFITKEIFWFLGVGSTRDEDNVARYHNDALSRMRAFEIGQGVPYLYRYIYITKEQLKVTENTESVLTFGKTDCYGQFMRRLSGDFNDLPELSVKAKVYGNTWSKGRGYLDHAEALHIAISGGKNDLFVPESWKGEYKDRSRVKELAELLIEKAEDFIEEKHCGITTE